MIRCGIYFKFKLELIFNKYKVLKKIVNKIMIILNILFLKMKFIKFYEFI